MSTFKRFYERFFTTTREISLADARAILAAMPKAPANMLKAASMTKVTRNHDPYVQFCAEYYSGGFVAVLNEIVNTGLLPPVLNEIVNTGLLPPATMKAMILTVDAALSAPKALTVQ